MLGMQPVRLIGDVRGDARQSVGVLAPVVGAEKEFTGREPDAHISAGTAPVAAVGGGQGLDRRRCHISM